MRRRAASGGSPPGRSVTASALAFLRARADNVAVVLLTAMFGAFIMQIVWRYVLRDPLPWTLEVCLITWLWTVFWGSAFLVRDADHVRFDILYLSAGPRLRRIFAAVAAFAIAALFAASLPLNLGLVVAVIAGVTIGALLEERLR